jgi:hypothetical protein
MLLPVASSALPGPVTPAATAPVGTARLAGQVHATAALSTSPMVGMASADGAGYWTVSSSGGVYSFGDAVFHGSAGNLTLAKPVVGMAATPGGRGYWLVASDGGIFAYGNAAFHGSAGNLPLAKPIVAMASTPDGNGYWLVASDGGIFAYGDAHFFGSMGNKPLAKPIVGMAATSDGRGYWLVASDGGIFNFGDAGFQGSAGNIALAKPIVGMAPTSDGRGYWLVASDGGVFNYGDAPFRGSAVAFNAPHGGHSIGITPAGAGYWVPNNLGQVASLGAPTAPSPSQPVVVTATTPPLPYWQMPPSSVPASGGQAANCYGPTPNVAACNAAALADIDSARAGEGLGPLVLPSNFSSLSTVAQLVVVADAERTSRGLPSLPENASLDAMAHAGAVAGQDPTGPSGYSWGSNIAWGEGTPLAADFGWMYDDGANSPNIDCPTASSAGCWGHRRNILSPWSGSAGAGLYVNNGTIQLTQLFVQSY